MTSETSSKRSIRPWPIITFIFVVISIGLLIGLIASVTDDNVDDSYRRAARDLTIVKDLFPTSPQVCGSTNPNGNFIDLSEPQNPGPFHDLTVEEHRALRTYLENDPNIRAVRTSSASIGSSYIFMVDLLVPRKAEVLSYLDGSGPKPPRQARVQMFRGDLSPPLVEEYICGPLPVIQECRLMNHPNRRNPVEFSVRPMNAMEFENIHKHVMTEVDRQLGYILRQSFGSLFTTCSNPGEVCLTFAPVPVGSALVGDINQRRMWMFAVYDVPYNLLHTVDFGFLCNLEGSDPTKWTAEKLWYAGRLYNSYDELKSGYDNGSIPTSKATPPKYNEDLFSTLHRRGEYMPPKPQRPPTLVEPDGKRYSVKNRKVDYMGWSFNFRMSSLTGPAVFDVRYKGERIAYEISLSEIAVFYSGIIPIAQATDYVDSGALIGVGSKSLTPGADCPDHATLLSQTFWSETGDEPEVYVATFCLFEQNNGYPLRRHSSYRSREGGFYGGMLDSALTLRSAMVIGNYDYIVDFIFHQNGIIESRFMSTGYIQTNPYLDEYSQYGFRIQERIMGTVHYHLAHFKVDLDIGGTSNRYETLDLTKERIPFSTYPTVAYDQVRVNRKLKKTEMDAVYDYNFETPKYHVVHNNNQKTKYNMLKAYRIAMHGMSKSLLSEGSGNEVSAAWNRHQMVVTRYKDEEFISGSTYGMFDSFNPTVNFSSYYEDDENIVDEDLVFWITHGLHHVPHTEDIPVTPTVGNHLTFFLLPYNYFPECPSMGSRDSMYIRHKDLKDPKSGVHVDRSGNSRDQCITPEVTLEEDLEKNPTQALGDS